MDRLLYTAMSGAKQTMDAQAVISNNLANASTSGFRRELSAVRAVPVQGDGELATRVSAAAVTSGVDWSPGPVSATGRNLDIALNGNAMLAVQDTAGNEAYTRRGDLRVDGNGLLVSGGRPVLGDQGPVVVPLGAEISVGSRGVISVIGEGERADSLVNVGRLKLVEPDQGQLTRGEDGLFRAIPEAGGETGVIPASDTASVTSGALEGSNVSAVESMVAMIDNSRRYDMQMKAITDAEENAQRADNLLRLQG